MLNNEQVQALRNALLDLSAMRDFNTEADDLTKQKMTEELKQAAKDSIYELETAFPTVHSEEGYDA
jgi:hypothetical protein